MRGKVILMFMTVIIMLSGCTRSECMEFSMDEDYVVKVLDSSVESSMELYGEMFMAEYPNVLIDVIPYPQDSDPVRREEKIQAVLAEENPDLILFGLIREDMNRWVEDGVLMDLGPLLAQDRKFRDGYHPGILQLTRAISGEDAIYGLGSQFRLRALYYRSDLFHDKGILPPEQHIDWQRTIERAEQFKHASAHDDEPIIGLLILGYRNIYSALADIAATEQLQLVEPGSNQILASEEWSNIFDRLLTGLREGYIWMPWAIATHDIPNYDIRAFLEERDVAMVLDSIHGLDAMDAQYWDAIPEPISAGNKNKAYNPRMSVYGINQHTDVLPAAWELLKFIVRHRSEVFAARTDLLYTYHDNRIYTDDRLQSLYQFTDILLPPLEDAPQGFFDRFAALAEEYLQEAVHQSVSTTGLIEELQQQGRELWLELEMEAGG